MPCVGQEETAQTPAASSSAAKASHGAGVEVIGSDDDIEGVELEHPDLMAESDAHHKKGTFKDPLVLPHICDVFFGLSLEEKNIFNKSIDRKCHSMTQCAKLFKGSGQNMRYCCLAGRKALPAFAWEARLFTGKDGT